MLDNCVQPGQILRVMKLRLPSAVLLVLYVAVACCFGVIHDHHHGHEGCIACAWLVNAVTDVPVSSAQISVPVVLCAARAPEIVVVLAPEFCAAASRAPPLAPA